MQENATAQMRGLNGRQAQLRISACEFAEEDTHPLNCVLPLWHVVGPALWEGNGGGRRFGEPGQLPPTVPD